MVQPCVDKGCTNTWGAKVIYPSTKFRLKQVGYIGGWLPQTIEKLGATGTGYRDCGCHTVNGKGGLFLLIYTLV